MPTLMELLPFLDGWRYGFERSQGQIIIGQQKTIFDSGGETTQGYFLEAGAELSGSLDGKYVTLYVTLDAPTATFQMKGYMMKQPMTSDARIIPADPITARYWNAQDTYAAIWTAQYPVPFKKRIQAYFSPQNKPVEETSPIPITYQAYIWMIYVVNPEQFLASYANLMRALGLSAQGAPAPPTVPATTPTVAPSTESLHEDLMAIEEELNQLIALQGGHPVTKKEKKELVINPPPAWPPITEEEVK